MKIFWTHKAIRKLKDIFDYYREVASKEVALKMIHKLVDRTMLLEANPHMGSKETLLKTRKREYRYLVEGNYKIIYFLDHSQVIIATVFDSRQEPKKIMKK